VREMLYLDEHLEKSSVIQGDLPLKLEFRTRARQFSSIDEIAY